MKKINFKWLVYTSIICLLPIILGLVYYNELPEMVAIHFDIYNNPDNYFSKELFVFALPVFMMIIQIFCCVMYDVQDTNKEANEKTIKIFKYIIPVITVIIYIITLMYSLGNVIDIRKAVMIIIGVMFVIMGNYTPKLVGNIHLRWPKIKNEKVYSKVKRIFGYIFIINGFLFMASILFDAIISICLIGVVVLEAIVLLIYTIIKNSQEDK